MKFFVLLLGYVFFGTTITLLDEHWVIRAIFSFSCVLIAFGHSWDSYYEDKERDYDGN